MKWVCCTEIPSWTVPLIRFDENVLRQTKLSEGVEVVGRKSYFGNIAIGMAAGSKSIAWSVVLRKTLLIGWKDWEPWGELPFLLLVACDSEWEAKRWLLWLDHRKMYLQLYIQFQNRYYVGQVMVAWLKFPLDCIQRFRDNFRILSIEIFLNLLRWILAVSILSKLDSQICGYNSP